MLLSLTYIHIFWRKKRLPIQPTALLQGHGIDNLVDGRDVSMEAGWYKEIKLVWAFNIATIGCVVRQVRVSDHWGIID